MTAQTISYQTRTLFLHFILLMIIDFIFFIIVYNLTKLTKFFNQFEHI